MHRLKYFRRVLLVLLLFAMHPARAQASAPAQAAEAVTTEASAAADLMAQGRYEEARLVFERMVLVDPRNAGAWLDLAIALRHLGDETTAQALLDHIEREFDPPPRLRELIARLRRPLAPAQTQAQGLARSRWSADIALLAGRESNANAAPGLTSLTLTLPDMLITVFLDPAFRPRPSPGTLVELRGEGEYRLSDSGLRLLGFAELKERRPAELPDFSTRQIQAMAGLRGTLPSPLADLGPKEWTLWAGAQQVALGGSDLLESNRLQFTLEQPLAACRAHAGAEAEERRFPVQPVLDGRFAGLLAGLSCPGLGGQWSLGLRLGVDHVIHPRPGDDQQRLDLTASLQRALFGRGRLEVVAAYTRTRDKEPYSALLGDVVRRIGRAYLRLELSHPISAGWDWLVRGEFQRQDANLALFDIRSNAVHAGFRKSF